MSVGETWPGSPQGTAEDCPWTPQQNDPGEQAACGSTGTLNPPRPTLKVAHVYMGQCSVSQVQRKAEAASTDSGDSSRQGRSDPVPGI